MAYYMPRRALSDHPTSSRPGATGALSRSLPDRKGGEVRVRQKGDRSTRQVPASEREVRDKTETSPDLPRPEGNEVPGSASPGSPRDGTAHNSPTPDQAAGPGVRPGQPPKDRPAKESGRVTREWLMRNALFVEYEDRNILGEIDSWPEPEGGFEVGLSREDILAAGRGGGSRGSWIAIEPDKNGIGGFCTRSRNDPGGNAR